MSLSDGTDPTARAPQSAATCAALAEVLSAVWDGEATHDEESRVREHVLECAACGRLLEEFATLDRSLRVQLPDPIAAEVGDLVTLDAATGSAVRVHSGSASMSAVPRRSFVARCAPWTRRVAAVLLAAVAAGLLVVFPGSNADAARIARSVATVEVLQDSERISQENLRRTLEWELRALRLEVLLLSSPSDAAAAAAAADDPAAAAAADDPAASVRERIDRLLVQVVEFADAPAQGGR